MLAVLLDAKSTCTLSKASLLVKQRVLHLEKHAAWQDARLFVMAYVPENCWEAWLYSVSSCEAFAL